MVVLPTKVYVTGSARERAMDSLGSLVQNAIGDLAVEFDIGLRHDEFPSVTITGDDETVARNVLREEWGSFLPHQETYDAGGETEETNAVSAETESNAESDETENNAGSNETESNAVAGETESAQETYVGTLESWSEDGIVLQSGESIEIPAAELGLGAGTPSQIRKRFGLVQHLPMAFVAGPEPRLADGERDRLFEWTRSENGRVNVNSATRAEVRATVNRAGHADDIVTIERLGLLEQSIVCQPDTDPPGLIASIGSYLPAELLAVVP